MAMAATRKRQTRTMIWLTVSGTSGMCAPPRRGRTIQRDGAAGPKGGSGAWLFRAGRAYRRRGMDAVSLRMRRIVVVRLVLSALGLAACTSQTAAPNGGGGGGSMDAASASGSGGAGGGGG